MARKTIKQLLADESTEVVLPQEQPKVKPFCVCDNCKVARNAIR